MVLLLIAAAVTFWVGFIGFFRALDRADAPRARRAWVFVMVACWLVTMGSVVGLALLRE